jgi:hypothetical protein
MAAIDDEIAALRAAVVSGVKKVTTRTNGVLKEVEYPSFADLKTRLDWLEGQKAGPNKRRGVLAAF